MSGRDADTRVLQFASRGVGYDGGAPCFVCGAALPQGGKNLAAFTREKRGGEEVAALFRDCQSYGRLDYRPSEPNWVQFKVLACDEHVANLELLHRLTYPDRLITAGRLLAAMNGE